jgi:N-methylhydantoinase A
LSFDLVRTRIVLAGPQAWREVAAAFAEIGRSAAEILDREQVPASERRALHGIDARYEGQNFEVHVGLDGLALDSEPAALDAEFTRRFRAAHAEVYGYDIPGRAIELVTLRLKVIGAVPKPQLAAPAAIGGKREVGRRRVYFDVATGWVETPVYDRTLVPRHAPLRPRGHRGNERDHPAPPGRPRRTRHGRQSAGYPILK